jgi:MerR family transcriptional regulator, thiopeptide resistance regulator
MKGGGWKVGELARVTGLTVRTLHHWDEIGLLRPSGRTQAGHRLYAEPDLRRLQQVVSLRNVGIPLEQIRNLLDRRGTSARDVISLHLDRLREQMRLQQALCARLEAVAARLDQAGTVSADELIQTIEATTMLEKYYTPEQQAELKARAEALGPEQIASVEAEWPRLMAQVQAELDGGTDPAEPRVQALAARWMELVQAFTGGNPGIAAAARNVWQQESTVHGIDTGNMRALMAYVQRALAAGNPSASAGLPGSE